MAVFFTISKPGIFDPSSHPAVHPPIPPLFRGLLRGLCPASGLGDKAVTTETPMSLSPLQIVGKANFHNRSPYFAPEVMCSTYVAVLSCCLPSFWYFLILLFLCRFILPPLLAEASGFPTTPQDSKYSGLAKEHFNCPSLAVSGRLTILAGHWDSHLASTCCRGHIPDDPIFNFVDCRTSFFIPNEK